MWNGRRERRGKGDRRRMRELGDGRMRKREG